MNLFVSNDFGDADSPLPSDATVTAFHIMLDNNEVLEFTVPEGEQDGSSPFCIYPSCGVLATKLALSSGDNKELRFWGPGRWREMRIEYTIPDA